MDMSMYLRKIKDPAKPLVNENVSGANATRQTMRNLYGSAQQGSGGEDAGEEEKTLWDKVRGGVDTVKTWFQKWWESGKTDTNITPLSVYDPVMGLLNQQEDQQTQEAYVNFQRFMNYLKMGNAAKGQQLTSGDQIQAQNNYQTQLGDIKSNFASLKTAAMEQEKAKADAKTEKDAAAAQAAAGKNETQTAYEQEQWMSTIQTKIGEVLKTLEVDATTGEYYFKEWQKLWNLYEMGKSKLSKNQQAMMEYYLNTLPHKAESTEQDDGGSSSGTTDQSPVKQVSKDFWEELAEAIARGSFGQ